ncbi:TPA: hypothetical protein DIC20_01395 [Candidatus Dependentiae bacterium]|nr:MAG: hypothetical protein US03_C0002G0114 [candidate division TM6 bacterium GW2011_GWF2_36_131]KKQ03547.1 MAG: hypothetical protein US13_C0002G0113 [candidate division TM6 bacterium GW2011_GWE2_36_25]KKQ20178.1 MAG: hypothetical protein US32_C0001G0075 [candidate division TM6 bacterium GW2011_GWA2_36_9]HBR70720.1 hypothetical protein [Candidatus Dependentiae bacterium]HCU00340.1 hypothetical protein [Candidatus Dependentiae bacterium]
MKKLIIILCSYVSLYSYKPLERIQEQLADIDLSLKIVQKEIESGFSREGQLKNLQLEYDILFTLMQNFSVLVDEVDKKTKKEDKAEKILSDKIDRFLNNIKIGCVHDCFAQKLEEKKGIINKIEQELDPLAKTHETSSIRKVAKDLKKQLEAEVKRLDDQIILIIQRTANAKSPKNFKCIGIKE